MHPNPGQLLIDNGYLVFSALFILTIALKVWLTPTTRLPVTCPFCTGKRTIKVRNPKSERLEDQPCPHCHATGEVASYQTSYQDSRRPCALCHGKATVIIHDGPIYPDGTPLPGSAAIEAPCPQPGCVNGLQTKLRQPIYSNVVPLNDSQMQAWEAAEAAKADEAAHKADAAKAAEAARKAKAAQAANAAPAATDTAANDPAQT